MYTHTYDEYTHVYMCVNICICVYIYINTTLPYHPKTTPQG